MQLTGKNLEFKHKNRSNPGTVLLLLFLCVFSFFILKSVVTQEIVSPWLPTAIPTRSADSYALEAETQFTAGNLQKAADAFAAASLIDPENPDYLWKRGRALAYLTSSQTTEEEKAKTLEQAIANLEPALETFSENSNIYAVLALLYNWYSDSGLLTNEESETNMAIAEDYIRRAVDFDSRNPMAYAFYAEILLDQANYERAEQMMGQALEYGQASNTVLLFDVYRVQGILLESYGQYRSAIDAYSKALNISPNMTFLMIRIGVNWRQITDYDSALEMFARAARINDQLGVLDPLPYLAIGNTYSQTGDFYAAGLNIKRALQINPYNADVYGRLGVNYYKARNYEAAIEALKCVVEGCGALESCAVRECADEGNPIIEIEKLSITSASVPYYFSYVGALAYMHTSVNHYCEDAVRVGHEIEAIYANDDSVMSIVRDGQAICARYGYS